MLWLNDLYQKILTDKGISDLFLSSFLYTHLQIDIMFYEGLVFTVFFCIRYGNVISFYIFTFLATTFQRRKHLIDV